MNNENPQNTRRRNSIYNVMRSLIIDKAINRGETLTSIAQQLQINRTTVNAIVKKFRMTGDQSRSLIKGHPPQKINEEMGGRIERVVETSPEITLLGIKLHMLKEYNFELSVSAIHVYLSRLKITLKRMGLVLDRVNDPVRLELRRSFAGEFSTSSEMDDQKNIFVDECGFNLHLRRNYGWSRTGNRVSSVVPTIRGRNTTLLCAINKFGVVHYKIFSGGCNGEIFSNFIRKLDEILRTRHNIYDGTIFMDNASAHRSSPATSAMTEIINNVRFISPYSYMLNPIEFCFGKVKMDVRSSLVDQDLNLESVISSALTRIRQSDCEGFYRLIRRNCALAMQGHVFNN